MPNMSYCRHELTSDDLRDVIDQWDDTEELTEEDAAYRNRLLRQCKNLLEMNGCAVDVAGTELENL
jgi:plasmid stabilization system protein ParE